MLESQGFILYRRIFNAVLKVGKEQIVKAVTKTSLVFTCFVCFVPHKESNITFFFTQWILSKLEEVRENQPKL